MCNLYQLTCRLIISQVYPLRRSTLGEFRVYICLNCLLVILGKVRYVCVVFCGGHVMFSLIWSCDLSWYVLFYGIWKIKSILEGQGLSFWWPQFRVVGWAKASILNVKSCILCMFCLSTCRWLCVCLVGLPCVWHPAPCQIICFMNLFTDNKPSFKLWLKSQ